jgi:hypothetical protein
MHDRDVMELIPKLSIPIVLVYCYDTSKKNYYVTYDNMDVIADVAEYLVKHGHEKIGVIKGAEDSLPSQKRLRSFITQLEKQDENQEVIQRLQGIWLDDNTEAPLFKIQGDSIYYASQINAPMPFSVHKIPIVVSRTAPTYLGVQTAHKHGLTLIGFARGKKMNLYTHSGRIDV